MIEWIVSSPVKVAVGVVLVLLFGGLAINSMPVQLTPEVQIPTITIETRWPGASPQEVERQIVQEQEEQLQSVEGVKKMSSESMDSQGRITLEFAVGTDLSQALLLVNTRLGQVQEYPEDADEPTITTSNASDRPIAWFILTQQPPTPDAVAAFVKKHPELRSELEHVMQPANPGLRIFRLRELCQKHPKAQSLLPTGVDVTTQRRFAEDFIESRFERVPGVSNSNVMGGREDELQVIVDPQRLAARQLTIIDVRNALRANIDVSGGDFWEGKRRYVVRTLGERRSVEQVAGAIIARRDDGPVYVRDVAQVRLGYKKPDGLMRRFGTSVVGINAQRETGANVLDVMDGLRETARAINEGTLRQRGMELTQVYDETDYIYSSIGLVRENIYEGGVLTFIALLVFLRSFRSSLVILTSIVVSVIGMFLVLSLMGRSLNVPSLAGIAFAVGMLVDNFIVVLENIFRHHQSGESAMTATVRGTREVWGAVLASTLANLAVFIPVLFVKDEAGQLFRDIALATSSALALSLFVALFLVPTAAVRVLPKRKEEPGGNGHPHSRLPWEGNREPAEEDQRPLVRWRKRTGAWLEEYGRVFGLVVGRILNPLDAFGKAFVAFVVNINAWVQASLRRQLVVAASFIVASVGLSIAMMPRVEYLPTGNRNLVFGILVPPPGYNLDQLTEMGMQIENHLRPYWDIDPNSPEAAKLDFPPIADFFYVARGRQLFMGMRAADPLRARELEGLVRQVSSFIPGTFVVAKQSSLFEQGLSAGRTVDIEITGPDIRKLVALGGQVLGRVQQVTPGAQARPVPSLDLSSPEMHVVPKWEQAADMGVSAADLGYTVDALVDGAYATDYYQGGDKIDLTILGSDKFTARTQDLEAMTIATPNGQLVPLAAVADVRMGSGPEQINRRERQRAITVEVTPPPGMPLEEAMDRIITQIKTPLETTGQLEGGYEINLSGTADKLRATWRVLRWNLLLALVITYLLMSALFESWLYPLVIITSVPLGAVGGFFGLWLLNCFVLQPLDVLTMLGFIILVGTVVNNPILIVEQALNHIRDDDMPPRVAVLESVRTRIRPIFMTAMIGLFGLLPLVVSPGAGSELYRGIGSVLLGGLVVSTIFTLVFVPTVFNLTMSAADRINRMLGRDIGHGRHPERPAPAEAEELAVR